MHVIKRNFEEFRVDFWWKFSGHKDLMKVINDKFSLSREIFTKNLRAVTRNFAQLCEIARNYAYIFGKNSRVGLKKAY